MMLGKKRGTWKMKRDRWVPLREHPIDKNWLRLRAECCSHHPEAHDDYGCIMCDCRVPESEAVYEEEGSTKL